MFENIGIRINGIISLTADEAYKISSCSIFIDIREDYLTGYKNLNVLNLIHLPASKFEEWKHNLPRDKQIIIFDSSGIYCRSIAQKLIEEGYDNIAILGGGIVEWERAGLPLIIDKTKQLDGSCTCQLKYRHKGSS